MDTDQPTPSQMPNTEGGGAYDQGGDYQTASLRASTEREVALRLIVSRAIVDADFYRHLKEDPQAAIDELHIRLDDADLSRFHRLDWARLDPHVEALRGELGFDTALRSGW